MSAIIGSILASSLKKYSSEKVAMERLKNSIIHKSKLITRGKTPILNSKKQKIEKIYKFALNYRGGQLEEFQVDAEISNNLFQLAQEIKKVVERLAAFLKERELKGIARIFFKSGRLILELLLYKCNINMSYSLLNTGLSTHIIVFTVTTGGVLGFTLSWFSVGASLVTPPLLISTLFLRSVTQQSQAKKEYSKLKKIVQKMFEDDELRETVRVVFLEEGQIPMYPKLEVKPLDLDQNSALTHHFNLKSGEDLETFIQARMSKELGLMENPTDVPLEEIIYRKMKRKQNGKTVLWRDFINEIPYQGIDVADAAIIDAEMIEKPIRIPFDKEP